MRYTTTNYVRYNGILLLNMQYTTTLETVIENFRQTPKPPHSLRDYFFPRHLVSRQDDTKGM